MGRPTPRSVGEARKLLEAGLMSKDEAARWVRLLLVRNARLLETGGRIAYSDGAVLHVRRGRVVLAPPVRPGDLVGESPSVWVVDDVA